MAVTVQIGGNGLLFIGEDKIFELELLDTNNNPVDMTGMNFLFVVRTRDGAPDPPIFSQAGILVGVYNSVRAVNTQRMTCSLTKAQMETVIAKTYRYSWKRIDSGFNTVAARGNFVVEITTQT